MSAAEHADPSDVRYFCGVFSALLHTLVTVDFSEYSSEIFAVMKRAVRLPNAMTPVWIW